jgi:uncharacterized protein YjdB
MDSKRTALLITVFFAASFLISCLERDYDNPILSDNPDDTIVVINPPTDTTPKDTVPKDTIIVPPKDTIIVPPKDTVVIPPKPIAVTGITAEPFFLPLGVAKGRPAVAVLPRNAANQGYSLQSLDASIVKVSGVDLVPVKAGTALVRARSAEGGFSVEFEAKVILTDTNHYETQVLAAPLEMVAGGAAMAPVITWTPSDVSNRGYTLSSSAPAKVQVVTEDGMPKCKPLAEGTAQITLRTVGKGLTTVFQATVKPKPILTVDVISISVPDMELDVGAADGVPEPVIFPSFATDKSFTLKSENPEVASINGTAIHAVSGGSARVKITSADGPSSTFQVTVRLRVKSISSQDMALDLGGADTVPAVEILPAGATNRAYSLQSEDPDVAAIKGTAVHAVSGGSARIKISSADGPSAGFLVTVRVRVKSLSAPDMVLDLGGPDAFPVVAFTPDSPDNKTYTLQSGNADVISITDDGLHAVSKGTALITLTSGDGPSGTFQATVRAKVKSISAPDLTMELGEAKIIQPSILPEDADDPGFTLVSSAPSVVGAKADGEIDAKKVGKAVITLASKDGGATSSFTVTVVKKIKEETDPPGIVIDLPL